MAELPGGGGSTLTARCTVIWWEGRNLDGSPLHNRTYYHYHLNRRKECELQRFLNRGMDVQGVQSIAKGFYPMLL